MTVPMTPAEIAAKMTPAQVDGLRGWNPPPPDMIARLFLSIKPEMVWLEQNGLIGRITPTDLGRAVLAVLDGGAA